MKYLIVVIILSMSISACSQKSDNTFVNKIVNDFSRNSYFLIINVSLPKGKVKSIIENDDLFYFFSKLKNYNEHQYKEHAANIISSNQLLTISEDDFSKFGFAKLVNVNSIQNDAIKGKDFILNKYFKDGVIIGKRSDEERNFLIELLFKWDIASRIDDETGYLVIEK